MNIRYPWKTSDVESLFRYPAPLSIFSQRLALSPGAALSRNWQIKPRRQEAGAGVREQGVLQPHLVLLQALQPAWPP